MLAACALLTGCGSTKSRTATEQLLMSDAVDRAIATVDFAPLAGRKVYFDTQYITPIKGIGFVNAEYIISSLRQQLVSNRCLLQDRRDDAEIIVEARVGALGTDDHEVTYGIPANNSLNSAASLVADAPNLPAFPELSVSKRNSYLGAAKIGVFAYNRETREPVWQAGIAQADSRSRSVWLFGAGPIQRGTIHEGTQFAGAAMWLPWRRNSDVLDAPMPEELSSYRNPATFAPSIFPAPRETDGGVQLAGHEKEETPKPAKQPAKPAQPNQEEPAAARSTADTPDDP